MQRRNYSTSTKHKRNEFKRSKSMHIRSAVYWSVCFRTTLAVPTRHYTGQRSASLQLGRGCWAKGDAQGPADGLLLKQRIPVSHILDRASGRTAASEAAADKARVLSESSGCVVNATATILEFRRVEYL